MSFATDMRDAQRLAKSFSRKQFRELPLEFVLVPSLDAPVLVFDELAPPVFTDATGEICHAQSMLDEMRKSARLLKHPPDDMELKRKLDLIDKRKRFMRLLRNLWCQMVDQARYYTWPDADHYGIPALFEFAPETV